MYFTTCTQKATDKSQSVKMNAFRYVQHFVFHSWYMFVRYGSALMQCWAVLCKPRTSSSHRRRRGCNRVQQGNTGSDTHHESCHVVVSNGVSSHLHASSCACYNLVGVDIRTRLHNLTGLHTLTAWMRKEYTLWLGDGNGFNLACCRGVDPHLNGVGLETNLW